MTERRGSARDRREPLWLLVSGCAVLVGLGFALAPRRTARLFGLPPAGHAGAADFAWRLFAVRTLVVGGGALLGSTPARRAILPVQVLDQVVFVHALATGSVPRRTALTAMATSAALVAGSLAAARQADDAR